MDLGGIHRAAKEKYVATYFVLAHAIAFAWNVLHPGYKWLKCVLKLYA